MFPATRSHLPVVVHTSLAVTGLSSCRVPIYASQHQIQCPHGNFQALVRVCSAIFRLLLVLLDLSFSSLFISDPTFSHYVLSWQMYLLWSMQYLPLCSKLMSAFTRNYSALSLESWLESWKPMILRFFSALPI